MPNDSNNQHTDRDANSSKDKSMENEMNPAKLWNKLLQFSDRAPHYAKELNPVVKSLDSLFKSEGKKDIWTNFLSVLTRFNEMQLRQIPEKKVKSANTKDENAPGLSGNDIYDILNSPAMNSIVKEVLQSKASRRKKK